MDLQPPRGPHVPGTGSSPPSRSVATTPALPPGGGRPYSPGGLPALCRAYPVPIHTVAETGPFVHNSVGHPTDRLACRADSDTSGNEDRKSTRLNSSHLGISYAVLCLKNKKTKKRFPRSKITLTKTDRRFTHRLHSTIQKPSYMHRPISLLLNITQRLAAITQYSNHRE